ncbi:flagellin [Aureimonas ureilytica]|nr:flagellin [Aureimonas ureilytica]
MTSVNTNIAAMTALRNLQATNATMETTQSRISTGFKINSAKDNAAYWAIATTLKSDNKSFSTVKDALNLGSATVDVAYQALNSAKNVLDELRNKLSAATSGGVDRTKIQSEIGDLQNQLKSIANSAVFSGENWLSVNSADASYSALKKVVSSFDRVATGGVTIGTVDIDTTQTALFDNNTAAGRDAVLDGAVRLTTRIAGVDTDLTYGGTRVAGNIADAGLKVAADTGVSGATTKETGPTLALGKVDLTKLSAGDKITFSITTTKDDQTAGAAKAVIVKLTPDAVSSVDKFKIALQSALDTAAPDQNVKVVNDNGLFSLTIVGSPKKNDSITLTDMTAVDGGDGKTTDVTTGAGTGATGVGLKMDAAVKGAKSATTPASGTIKGDADLNIAKLYAGDKLTFTIGLTDPNNTTTSSKDVKIILTSANTKDNASFVAALQEQIDNKFGSGQAKVEMDGAKLKFTNMNKSDKDTDSEISVTTAVADTDGNKTDFGGLISTAQSATGFDKGADGVVAEAAKANFQFNAVTLDDDDSISFKVAVDGYPAFKAELTKASIVAALPNSGGSLKTTDDMVAALNGVFTAQGYNTKVVAEKDSKTGDLVIRTTSMNVKSTLAITDLAVSAGATTAPQGISVMDIDISQDKLTARGADTADKQLNVINAYINIVNTALSKVTAAATSLGSVAKRIDSQSSFVNTLMDTIEKGISSLVDADMSEESTRLQALQVKQQLGVQALAMANQTASQVLKLFQ